LDGTRFDAQTKASATGTDRRQRIKGQVVAADDRLLHNPNEAGDDDGGATNTQNYELPGHHGGHPHSGAVHA
jgi:hypothetical protein